MGDSWQYTVKGEKRGPIDKSTLETLASSGILKADDLVWTEGMSDWAPASGVVSVFTQPPPVPAQARVANAEPPPVPPQARASAAEPPPIPGPAGKWFYMAGDQRKGPIDVEALRSLIARKVIFDSTMVWNEGFAEWKAAGSVEGLLPVVSTNEPRIQGAITGDVPDVVLPGIVLLVATVFALQLASTPPSVSTALLGLLVIFASLGLNAHFIFKAYVCLPEKYRGGVSPEKAAGLLFVPLFNLYWVFPVLRGLATGTLRALNDQRKTFKPEGPVLPNLPLDQMANLACMGFVVGFGLSVFPIGLEALTTTMPAVFFLNWMRMQAQATKQLVG